MESQLSNNEVETMHAIQQLIEFRNSRVQGAASDHDEQQLIVKLLSHLESLKSDDNLKQSGSQLGEVEAPASAVTEPGTKNDPSREVDAVATGDGLEEIMKEIKIVRRQNTITHCLLSALIFLTVAFQLSEISMVLKFKNGITHPFRSLGSVLTGMVKRPNTNGTDILDSNHSTSDKDNNHSEGRSNTPRLPALPQLELELPVLPGIVLNGAEE